MMFNGGDSCGQEESFWFGGRVVVLIHGVEFRSLYLGRVIQHDSRIYG